MDGNGKMTKLLEQLVLGQDRLTEQVAELVIGQERLRTDLKQLRTDMNTGFEGVNKRIDGVIRIAGGHHGDHEQRISALEDQVFKKPS
jgi:hypothetical protein